MMRLSTHDPKPLYEQIMDNYRRLIVSGGISPGEQLPSVRELAESLAINPNTIQKAYGELERQGVIYSLAGRGNFISPDISRLADTHREELLSAVEGSIRAAAEYGVPRAAVEERVAKSMQNYGGDAHDPD